jgi:hypothetical protein
VHRFALGLLKEFAAVQAALSEPWSQGQVEGQITKLKLLKRQMDGRANIDLLRLRLLHAASSPKQRETQEGSRALRGCSYSAFPCFLAMPGQDSFDAVHLFPLPLLDACTSPYTLLHQQKLG